jgi:hypothetical protein
VSPTAVLAQLLADDPDGLERLQALGAPRHATTVDTPHGPVVAVDGRKLHSGRDPVHEARRFARELDLADANVVVLFGFGSGHVARAIAARSTADILVFEPDLEVLAVGAAHGPIDPRTRVVTTPSRLGEVLYARLRGSDRGLLATWTPSVRTAPALYDAAKRAAAQAVDRASLRHRTARIRGPGWLRHYLENLPGLAAAPGLASLEHGLCGVPAIIVAAGPSLDDNLEDLRRAAGSAFILAVNTAATALGRAGIRPSAVVAIESLDVSSQLAALPFLREVPAFLELTGHPELWKLPFARRLPISVDTNACSVFSAQVDAKHHLSAGFCVANAAVAIAYALGCDPIVLVGSDLAYKADRVYASGTAFADMRATVGADGNAALTGLAGKRAIEGASRAASGGVHMPDVARTMTAPGWGGGPSVTTTRDFAMFRDWYTSAAKTLRAAGMRAINATEGGLHIPGWDDMRLCEAVPVADGVTPGDDAPMRARVAALLTRPPSSAARIAALLEAEREQALAVIELAHEAHRQIADDPDGDLALDEAGAERLAAINRETGMRLKAAPLCAEAVFAPIEDLRARGRVTTYGFYAALVEPLCELASQLARTSQRVLAVNDGVADSVDAEGTLAVNESVAASVDAEEDDVSRAVPLPCSPPPTSSPQVLPPVSQRVA